jgi:hypothetical protein
MATNGRDDSVNACSRCGRWSGMANRVEGYHPQVGSLEFCSVECHNRYLTPGGKSLPAITVPAAPKLAPAEPMTQLKEKANG